MNRKMNLTIFLIIAVILIVFISCKKFNAYMVDDETVLFTSVFGTIEKVYLHEIPNKALGKKPKIVVRIELQVTEVYFKNRKINTSDFSYPTFRGNTDLIDLYKEGDKVKITCTTTSGRHIKTIEKL